MGIAFMGEGACVWVVEVCKTGLGSGSMLECWEDEFFEMRRGMGETCRRIDD
jgi:hypothetical protein